VHKFTRFLMQRAEAFFILRRKPVKVCLPNSCIASFFKLIKYRDMIYLS
jgi:hypothetical protein